MNREEWEEIEEKKRFLRGYIAGKRREQLILDQIQKLRFDATCPEIKGYDGMPGGSGGDSDLSDYFSKIEELEEKLEAERLVAVKEYEKIYQAIKDIDDPDQEEALRRYYILREKWDEIPKKMGWSRSKTFRIYDEALKKIKIPEKRN